VGVRPLSSFVVLDPVRARVFKVEPTPSEREPGFGEGVARGRHGTHLAVPGSLRARGIRQGGALNPAKVLRTFAGELTRERSR